MKYLKIVLIVLCLMLSSCAKLTEVMGGSEESYPNIVEKMDTNYYFYNQFNLEEQMIYDEFLKGVQKMDHSIKLETTDHQLLQRISWAIIYDHPELFWYNGGFSSTKWFESTTLEPAYTMSRKEAIEKQVKIEEATIGFLNTLPTFSSDYEKVKHVFDYVVSSVEYVSDCEENQNIYSALVNKESVCAGYAKSCQYLLQQLGVECLYVYGTAKDTAHAWNIVKCDNAYYQMDATFGDRMLSEESTMPDKLRIKYVYLCATDEEMLVDREVQSEFELPTCNSLDLNFHRLNHIYFETYSKEDVGASMELAVRNGLNYWEGRFSNKIEFEKALEAIRDSLYTRIALDYLNETEGVKKLSSSLIYDEKYYVISCWY